MSDITAVLEIDVQDAKFKTAQAELDSFLSKLQEASKLSGLIGSSKAMVARPSGALMAPKTQMDDFGKSLKDATSKTGLFSAQLAKTTTGIAIDSGKKLGNAFVSLTKTIMGTGGLVAGITSMATLAGIIKTSMGTQQKAFMANIFGINPNDISRMQSTWGQIADVGSVLQSLEAERENPASYTMAQLGYTPGQAAQTNVMDIFDRALERAQEVIRSPLGINETSIRAAGLEGVFDIAALKRMKNIGPEGIQELRERDIKYRQETQLEDPKKWQQFGSEIGLRRLRLETTFQNALTKLLDPILRVMDSLREKFMGGAKGGLASIIDKVALGLDLFDKALSKGEWDAFWVFVKDTARDAWKSVSGLAVDAWKAIGDTFKTAFPKETESLREFMAEFKIMTQAVSEFVDIIKQGMALIGITPSKKEAIPQESVIDKWHDFKKEHRIPTINKQTFGKVVDFFKGKGWSEDESIGLAANFQGESGFNPKAVGDKGKAVGVGQWHPERQKDFMELFGKSMQDASLEEQLEFAHYELTQGKEQKAGRMLRGAKGEEAIEAVTRFYERPADISGAASERKKMAGAYKKSSFVSAQQRQPVEMAQSAVMSPVQRAFPYTSMDKTVRIKIDDKHSSADLSIQTARMFGNSYVSGKNP